MAHAGLPGGAGTGGIEGGNGGTGGIRNGAVWDGNVRMNARGPRAGEVTGRVTFFWSLRQLLFVRTRFRSPSSSALLKMPLSLRRPP